MDRYYRYSSYLKERYGGKTYKLPINLPLSCPNRDGLLGQTGCAFCGEKAAGFESLPSTFSVRKQLAKNKEYIGQKYRAEHYIAYFQNYTNTYLPLGKLIDYVEEALALDDLVEIAISTRPDCINEEYVSRLLSVIKARKPQVNLSFELGLQTVNYHTLLEINRGHTLAEFIDAVLTIKAYQAELGVHLILNLPGDTLIDVQENAKILSALKIDHVKLHALYIREGTRLGEDYQRGELRMISLADYIERVINFLEYLAPTIAVQRLLGRAPEEGTLFANWDHSWWKIHQLIIREMEERATSQGKKYNYLGGKALQQFS